MDGFRYIDCERTTAIQKAAVERWRRLMPSGRLSLAGVYCAAMAPDLVAVYSYDSIDRHVDARMEQLSLPKSERAFWLTGFSAPKQ